MKNRNRKVVAMISGFACVLAVTSACSSSKTDSDANGGTSNGTLIIDQSFQVTTVDPARAFSLLAFMVDHATYQTLLSFNGSDVTKPIPLVAESYTPSSDFKTYTFKLRHDIKFADGKPLTAEDVVYSLNRVANIKGNPAFLMDGLTVTSQGNYTVTIKSKSPVPQLPAILTTPALAIVNSKLVAAHGGTTRPKPAQKTRRKPTSKVRLQDRDPTRWLHSARRHRLCSKPTPITGANPSLRIQKLSFAMFNPLNNY